VVVDLADPRPDGPPGEPDTLLGIEEAIGSAGADTLRGDANANLLQAAGGDDTVDGRAGDDVLWGGTGFDRLTGGPGNDELASDSAGNDEFVPWPAEGAREPSGETADCGEGADLVSEQDHDILTGCERLELPLGVYAPTFDPRPTLDGRTATLRLRCSVRLRFHARQGCRVKVTLSARGRSLGTRTVRIKGSGHAVRVPLRAAAATMRVELRYLAVSDDRDTVVYVARTSSAA
jgi:hypothetical protein